MEDRELVGRINELVNEEHERLRQLEVNLDQGWDLFGQRRALREAGYDPDKAMVVRDEKREDRRRLLAVTPQPGCEARGRSLV